MPDQTPRLDLPLMLPSQAQKHVTHNEAIDRLDGVVQLALQALAANDPPEDPAEGAVWHVGAAPTGAWIGQGGSLARWRNNGWDFVQPGEGWIAWDIAASKAKVWVGGQFADLPAVLPAYLQTLQGLGLNTSADATNRLAISAPATLLTHEGQGHQLKINKAGVTDTASLLFQTNWSGRAELGLAGTDTFSVKVSSNGSDFATALTAGPGGRVGLPVGLEFGGLTSDPAGVQEGWVWRLADEGLLRCHLGGRTTSLNGISNPWLQPPSGEYVMTTVGGGTSTGTIAGAANRIELFPFVPRVDLSIDMVALNVTTAVASALAKVVIYGTDSWGRPDAKLVETADIGLDVAGVRTGAAVVTLRQGLNYWLGVRHSSNATLSSWNVGSVPDINGGQPSTTGRKTLRRTLAYGTPAPGNWGYLSSEINSANPSAIWLRIA